MECYKVEYAKSIYSTCTICKKDIEIGFVRIVKESNVCNFFLFHRIRFKYEKNAIFFLLRNRKIR